MTQNQLIADIVPLKRLPQELTQVFSYLVPAKLLTQVQIGDLVTIPFKNKQILGIIINIKSCNQSTPFVTDFTLKEIINITQNEYFTKQNLQTFQFIAQYYHCPLTWVFKIATPQPTKQLARKDIPLNKSLYKLPDLDTETIQQLQQTSHALLFHNLQTERINLYGNLISTTSKQQNLILVPEYLDIYNYAYTLQQNFGTSRVAIISSDLTKNQFFQEWQKIQTGVAKIIIGTKQAVFMPFKNLKYIILDDEHNANYKQKDQSPRYHAREVAVKMSEIYQAKILLASPTPSLEAFKKTSENFTLITIKQLSKAFKKIVDMTEEKHSGNYNIISQKLHQLILDTLYQKKQIVIFIPRLGEHTITQCQDCGFTAVCSQCDNTLVTAKNQLYCSRCKISQPLLVKCPNCQGVNLKAFGGGSSRVCQEINNLLINKNIKIQEMSSQTLTTVAQQRKLYQNFIHKKIDILIGTQTILRNWQSNNLGLMVVIFPETIFHQNHFRSKEKIWQTLYRFLHQPNTNTVIQTHKPTHQLFQQMSTTDFQQFLQQETQDRQTNLLKIPYPPFGKILKLTHQHSDNEQCQKAANLQYQILKKIIIKHELQNSVEIIAPFQAVSSFMSSKNHWNLILRYKNTLPIAQQELIISSIQKNWILDIDPEEIL